MRAPVYTTCVDRKHYKNLSYSAELIVAIVSFVLFGLIGGIIGSVISAMSFLQKLCQYLLHGKLVCLGEEQCALGRVTSFETVDEKNLSINLITIFQSI